jgi:hypothetical protein
MLKTGIAQPTLINRLRNLTHPQEPMIPDLYPCKLRDPLLSKVETSFYQVLLAIIGQRVVICPKMLLADVIRVNSTPSAQAAPTHQAFFQRIASQRIDFLLCERYTLKPLLAVQLYDHSQPKTSRKKRDPFIDRVFKAAKLPVLHLVAQADYHLRSLALRIAPYLTTVAYSRTSEPIQLGVPPRCPCCHTPMVKRTVISGQYKGQTYYSCRSYPDCCERLPLSKAKAYVN